MLNPFETKIKKMELKKLAQTLDLAAKNAKPIEQLSLSNSFDETTAYAIQKASLEERYARGEKFIGLKMGFTSKAKMEQMGVHDLIWGRLTDKMRLENNGKLELQKFIHPRVEPEICFLVKKEIQEELTLENAPEFIEAIAPALEIIDSRYQNFKFSLEDVIADNCSSAALVLGEWQKPEIDIKNLKIDLSIDGKIAQSGSSNAILENPWLSLCHASRLAQKYNQAIPVGSIIMAGAATSAVFLGKNQQIKAIVEELGSVAFSTF